MKAIGKSRRKSARFACLLALLALPALLSPPLAVAQVDGDGEPAGDEALLAAPAATGTGPGPAADDPAEADRSVREASGVADAEAADQAAGVAELPEDAAGVPGPPDEAGVTTPNGDAAEAAPPESGGVADGVADGDADGDADASAGSLTDAGGTDDVAGTPAGVPAGDEAITVLDQAVPVAEDPATSGAAEPAPAVGPPRDPFEDPALSERERLELAFNRFQEYREAGLLPEAENAAKRAVEIAIGLGGPGSNDTAKALTNLGAVQYDTKDYEAAKQNFLSAIDIYKTNEDQLSARLINPLRGLGAAQLESGRPDEAMNTYRQAMHISHVNEGPHNLDQLPILEALAETQLRMGTLEDAKNTQDMIYALNLRHIEGDSMNLVPPLMRRAAWQRRTGYVLDERATYRRVIRIIEESRGDVDIALIEPLIKLAESYYYIDVNDPTSFQAAAVASGEIYFKRALRIAEESPDSDWRIQADTMLALADYYTFRADANRARRAYRDAWDFLSTDPDRLRVREAELEQVHVLNEDPIPQYVGQATRAERQHAQSDVREGTVIASYDVSARGRMSSMDIVELNPPVFEDMANEVVRELRDRIFRPRFVDGEPVDSDDQVLTHRFFYLQDDLDQRLASADAETE